MTERKPYHPLASTSTMKVYKMCSFTATSYMRLHIMVMGHLVNITLTTDTADSDKIRLPADESPPTQSTCPSAPYVVGKVYRAVRYRWRSVSYSVKLNE